MICDSHCRLDGFLAIRNLFNRMIDVATNFICNGHWVFIVRVISSQKDLNLRVLIEEEAKVLTTTFSLVSC
ncbi:Uncharacterised protein [Mycobacterium tuberculosis]|nr:Uncharacterised protein [Mycobacterium tuberculosis]